MSAVFATMMEKSKHPTLILIFSVRVHVFPQLRQIYSSVCVSDKAKVIYSPPEVYLPYGHPAVLDCHFRSNPPLKNLRWEKDGLLFDSYNVPVGVCFSLLL